MNCEDRELSVSRQRGIAGRSTGHIITVKGGLFRSLSPARRQRWFVLTPHLDRVDVQRPPADRIESMEARVSNKTLSHPCRCALQRNGHTGIHLPQLMTRGGGWNKPPTHTHSQIAELSIERCALLYSCWNQNYCRLEFISLK